jgi:hypothetical protein
MKTSLLFLLWMILHIVSGILVILWVLPCLCVMVLWGNYKGWGMYDTPDWCMPWALAAPYARFVDRITGAKK